MNTIKSRPGYHFYTRRKVSHNPLNMLNEFNGVAGNPKGRVIHPVGVQKFEVNGTQVFAINERNAIRKSKKVA